MRSPTDDLDDVVEQAPEQSGFRRLVRRHPTHMNYLDAEEPGGGGRLTGHRVEVELLDDFWAPHECGIVGHRSEPGHGTAAVGDRPSRRRRDGGCAEVLENPDGVAERRLGPLECCRSPRGAHRRQAAHRIDRDTRVRDLVPEQAEVA